jgi:hypothetical protein
VTWASFLTVPQASFISPRRNRLPSIRLWIRTDGAAPSAPQPLTPSRGVVRSRCLTLAASSMPPVQPRTESGDFRASICSGLMRKITEYEDHAQVCRKMAASVSKPEHKQQLIEIAEAWEMLARERLKQLERTLRRA